MDFDEEFDTVMAEFREITARGLTLSTEFEIRNCFGRIGYLLSSLLVQSGDYVNKANREKLNLEITERRLIALKYDSGAMTLRTSQAKNDPDWLVAADIKTIADNNLLLVEMKIKALEIAHSTLSRESSYRLKL